MNDLRGQPWRSKLGTDAKLEEVLAILCPFLIDKRHVRVIVIFNELLEAGRICELR
jgi:hypothetical protein